MKDVVTTRVANRELEPIIRHVRAKKGGVVRMLKALNRRTRKNWQRANLERWLATDPEKRIQPLFGVGLLLVQIGKAIIAEDKGAKE